MMEMVCSYETAHIQNTTWSNNLEDHIGYMNMYLFNYAFPTSVDIRVQCDRQMADNVVTLWRELGETEDNRGKSYSG
jgi:hypothetical protein